MKFSTIKFIGVFCFGAFFLTGCLRIEIANQNANLAAAQANQAAEKNAAQSVKDDVEELGKIVNLPATPEEATYREENFSTGNSENQASAPNRKKLTAVLKFSPEDAGRIVEEAGKYKPFAESKVDAEAWFPAELIAQSQLSGDETLKGASFAADDFFRPPYSAGKITRLANTNFFVLELTTF